MPVAREESRANRCGDPQAHIIEISEKDIAPLSLRHAPVISILADIVIHQVDKRIAGQASERVGGPRLVGQPPGKSKEGVITDVVSEAAADLLILVERMRMMANGLP